MKRSLCLLAAVSIFAAGTPESADQRRQARQPQLKVGQTAPTFKLEYLNSNKDFDLKDSLGKKPVVVIFGSYT